MLNFKALAKMYKTGTLTKELRHKYRLELDKLERESSSRKFKTQDGKTLDLVHLKKSVLGTNKGEHEHQRHFTYKKD